MSKSICDSVHNIAFITAGYVSRKDIVFGTGGFIIGLVTSSSICSMM